MNQLANLESKQIKVPQDFNSGHGKGFAFAEFDSVESAEEARGKLDGRILQGRLLHVLPAFARKDDKMDDFALSQLPMKKRKLAEKRAEAASSVFSWNSLYMNTDAVLSSAAARLGLDKSELLDPTASDAAVKQAQIETHTIQDARRYFETNGVSLDSLGSRDRDGNALLVKNFKYDTKAQELRNLFAQSGDVKRILMPPGGTIAIVEFANAMQAKSAFSALAFRKLNDSILFLERAPKNLFSITTAPSKPASAAEKSTQGDDDGDEKGSSTLFVRNLNFVTTSQRLHEAFQHFEGLTSATVKTKPDLKHKGQTLSMGFGFVEFASNELAGLAALSMNGHMLDDHELEVRASHRGLDAAAQRKKDDQAQRKQRRISRLIVKNLPFEASRKDVRSLFGSYGQVKAVRLPKKFDHTSRGYAFVDFTSPQHAEKAMELSRTHLLGRRLVIDYAAAEAEDAEQEIEKMQEKVGRQSDHVAMQKMAGGNRKKFIAGETEEGMEE